VTLSSDDGASGWRYGKRASGAWRASAHTGLLSRPGVFWGSSALPGATRRVDVAGRWPGCQGRGHISSEDRPLSAQLGNSSLFVVPPLGGIRQTFRLKAGLRTRSIGVSSRHFPSRAKVAFVVGVASFWLLPMRAPIRAQDQTNIGLLKATACGRFYIEPKDYVLNRPQAGSYLQANESNIGSGWG
jgi:hypothetical protein